MLKLVRFGCLLFPNAMYFATFLGTSDSVILSGGPYCSIDGGSVQHAVPGTTISSIICAVDNPSPGANLLEWTIPSIGLSLSNVNGADGIDASQGFVATVNSFDNDEDTTNATLTFTAKAELDGAIVICADVTETSSNCTLSVLNPPSHPLDIICDDYSQTFINVRWNPSVDNDDDSLIEYEVTRVPGGLTYTSQTSLLASDLVPWTNYTFSVRANNSAGFSNSSEAIYCRTLGEVYGPVLENDIESCLGYNEATNSDVIEINITRNCPPVNPNPSTTPEFQEFNITTSGLVAMQISTCQYVFILEPDADPMEYDVSVTIVNDGGQSRRTFITTDSYWITDILADFDTGTLGYSVADCTTVEDVVVNLTITESGGSTVLTAEQTYDTKDTTFDINSLSTTSATSYNFTYTLLVSRPGTTFFSMVGGVTHNRMLPSNSFSSVSSSSSGTVFATPMPTATNTADCLSSSVAAGISVAVTVPVTAVITVLITVIILYLCGYQRASKRHSEKLPQNYESPISTTSVLELKSNTAYGQVQYTTESTDKQTTSTSVYDTVNN